MTTKTCTKCLREFDLAHFSRDRSRKDGLCNSCKECAASTQKAWREANVEHLAATGRSFRTANAEKLAADAKAYYDANAERLKAKRKTYYAANTERVIASVALYANANPEKVAAYKQVWCEANPEKVAGSHMRTRARKAGVLIEYVPDDIKTQLIDLYGPVCMAPGCEGTDLTLDHIVPMSKGGPHAVSNLQLLCQPCNSGKRDWHNTDYRPEGLTL